MLPFQLGVNLLTLFSQLIVSLGNIKEICVGM